MRRHLIAALSLAVLSTSALAQITVNIGGVSDYRVRGITQSFNRPALQGGIDYTHSNGAYLGNFNSSVATGSGSPGSRTESLLYGGVKRDAGKFLGTLDVGVVGYYRLGSNAGLAPASFTNPRNGTTAGGSVNNHEFYVGSTWGPLTIKYYQSMGDYFSLPSTRGAYLDLQTTHDLGDKWTLTTHLGQFQLRGWDGADYTDWKVGINKEIAGWNLGAAYVASNAQGNCAAGEFYCFSRYMPAAGGTTNAGAQTVVFSVGRNF